MRATLLQARVVALLPDLGRRPRTSLAPLLCEIVPRKCMFSNVRTLLAPEAWKALSDRVRAAANWRCEVCGDLPPALDLHCHEVWSYEPAADVNRGHQVLAQLQALCALCHEVKHLGFATLRGRKNAALVHMQRVNGWAPRDVARYLARMRPIWRRRDRMTWTCDVSLLQRVYGVEVPVFDKRPPTQLPEDRRGAKGHARRAGVRR